MKDLSLHILDLIQNSIAADASKIEITIRESIQENKYLFIVKDNGCGMSCSFLKKITDPYTTTRTTRKVGLGIPLLKMNAEHCNGGFKIISQLEKAQPLPHGLSTIT